MTTDFFALLGEERRPSLDPERVKETFHRLSRTEHPDQTPTADGDGAFARLNEAQAALREPKSRLRHLLELEFPAVKLSGPTNVPSGLADRFAAIHGLLREIDGLLARKTGAASALARALLAREEHALRERAESALEDLDTCNHAAMEELREFDARWIAAPRPADAAGQLHSLYQRFAYLSRWSEQLRERLFTLGM